MEDIFDLLHNFVSEYRLELMCLSYIESIRSSLIHEAIVYLFTHRSELLGQGLSPKELVSVAEKF